MDTLNLSFLFHANDQELFGTHFSAVQELLGGFYNPDNS